MNDCQRDVMAATACLRGGSTKLPKVTVVSEAKLRERIATLAPLDDDAKARYARWNRGLSLFDLAPADYDSDRALDDSLADVAAMYLLKTKEILVVDRSMPLDDSTAVEVLAHEVVHALQDAEYDLQRYRRHWGTGYDAALAIDGLIEGEAVLYQVLAGKQLAPPVQVATSTTFESPGVTSVSVTTIPFEINWEAYFTDWRTMELKAAETDKAPVAMADERFSYAFGGGFVAQYWMARGRAGIDALFEHPPTTTREILFGAASEDLAAAQHALDTHAVPVLQDSFADVGTATLGAWIARIYAARVNVPLDMRLAIASSWAADVFSVQYAAEVDAVVAAWRVRVGQNLSPFWPGKGHESIVESYDNGEREAYLVAAQVELPAAIDMLSWRTPAKDVSTSVQTNASIGLPIPQFFPRRVGCHVRHPPL